MNRYGQQLRITTYMYKILDDIQRNAATSGTNYGMSWGLKCLHLVCVQQQDFTFSTTWKQTQT